ncbi:MAG: caspase family protein [Flavobacteriales bacterium]|nr:caspase family protein [Flavobacteriales bacterium]
MFTVKAADTGMGKVCVVFIENSNYTSFPSINGPEKDVALMKSALASYEVEKVVHKKNLTKKQMQAFFATELKQIVVDNQIQSILIWYAGHGKYINNHGYWIPVDAVRDNESTYFSTNTLKTALKAYSKAIVHTLMVTDACESGPSFYQSMRDAPAIKDCGSNAADLKSSQIFSSSGYELAVENSQFTQTFAKALSGSNASCIPIEKIVTEVTKHVIMKNKQRPKFGVINDFDDQDGTFFFIKKTQ